MLWTWLGLCLGRARPEQRGSRSPSSRGCRGVSVSHTRISGILVSVCPWELAPLEIWELHPGGRAFPVAVPVLSLHLQRQSRILRKGRILSFQDGLRDRTPSEVQPACANFGKDEGIIHGGASYLAGDQGVGEGAGGVTTLYHTLQKLVVQRQATTKILAQAFGGSALVPRPQFLQTQLWYIPQARGALFCPSCVH